MSTDDVTFTVSPSSAPSRPSSFREDCWSEAGTHTLVEAWGDRYLSLERGNLRQKHWQEVADAVNVRHHGGVKNMKSRRRRRTAVQCKNRIDTLKKRYKVEKSKSGDDGAYVSAWPFFEGLDNLIGSSIHSKKPSPAPHRKITPGFEFMSSIPVAPRSAKVIMPATISGDDTCFRLNFSALADMAAQLADDDSDSSRSRSKSSACASRGSKIMPGFTSPIPVAPRSATVKRPAKIRPPAPIAGDDPILRGNFSAFADLAAKLADDDSDTSAKSRSKSCARASQRRKRKNRSVAQNLGCADVLAEAMGKFGAIYERVEGAKQRQMVELEKQRMQFAKDLEVHRMKMYVDMHVQLEKMKRAKRSHRADSYS